MRMVAGSWHLSLYVIFAGLREDEEAMKEEQAFDLYSLLRGI